jgi:hypothetical protein
LIDRDATLWVAGRAIRGRDTFVAALPEVGFVSLSEVEWLVGIGRWEALCSTEAANERSAAPDHAPQGCCRQLADRLPPCWMSRSHEGRVDLRPRGQSSAVTRASHIPAHRLRSGRNDSAQGSCQRYAIAREVPCGPRRHHRTCALHA